jgi:hypothetical protein
MMDRRAGARQERADAAARYSAACSSGGAAM